jgi:hypothetical protein
MNCDKYHTDYVDMIKSYVVKGKSLSKNEKERIKKDLSKAYKGKSIKYDDAI